MTKMTMSVRRGWFLAAVALGTLLNPLNTSMIAVALARLQTVYHLDFTAVSWIVSTFYLASAVAQPAWGKVADLYGRKTVFLVGLVVVAVASIAAPFAPSFGWLIGFRILQSVGSSAIYPAGMALVRHHITDRQAQALAVLSVFSSASAGFGPVIGGLLIHFWNWPAIFVVNIPFIAGAFVLALWVLPADARSTAGRPSWRQVFTALDVPGIALFTVAVMGILLVLLSLHSQESVIAGLVGLAALGFFIWREFSATQPFVPLRTFAQSPGMTLVDLQYIAVNILFYAVFFGIPTYLQNVRHVGAEGTGFIMLSLAACSVVVAPMAGRWIHRSGARPALVLAGLLMTVGSLWIITFHGDTPIVSVFVALILLGIANGLNNVGMQTALFAVTPKAIIGTASGLFMTARFLGTIASSLLLDLVFGATVTTAGLRLLGALLAGVGIVIVMLSRQLPRARKGADAP
ncbi:MAG: MFS transporter [Bacilli bacterium]